MSERIPIVDANNTVITYKGRHELDIRKDAVRSSSVWITNSKGEILLAERKFDKRTDSGKWAEAVGGTVEEGETYESTAYREAAEELGIEHVTFIIGPKQFIAGPPATYFVQWYYARLDWPLEKFTPSMSEVEQIAWWTLEALEQDLKNNPDQYISALPEMIRLLRK